MAAEGSGETWADAGDRLGDLGKHPHNSHSGAQAGTGGMEGECVPAVYLACGGPNLSVRTGSGAQNGATTPTADGSPPPAPPLAPGITVQVGLDGAEDPTMEIWVDDTGIVRKSIMSPQLGGETITVTSVSGDPFQPVFPTPDAVSPFTAEVLFHLGI